MPENSIEVSAASKLAAPVIEQWDTIKEIHEVMLAVIMVTIYFMARYGVSPQLYKELLDTAVTDAKKMGVKFKK